MHLDSQKRSGLSMQMVIVTQTAIHLHSLKHLDSESLMEIETKRHYLIDLHWQKLKRLDWCLRKVRRTRLVTVMLKG